MTHGTALQDDEPHIIPLDRVDSTGSYVEGNVVPCCSACNRIKGARTLTDFLDSCANIVNFTACTIEVCTTRAGEVFPRMPLTQYAQVSSLDVHLAYQNRWSSLAPRKDKGREVPALHGPMRLEPCYLCGTEPAGGIDRVDSAKLYNTPDNTRPCCKTCNMAKNAAPLKCFLSQMARITQWWSG